MIEQAEINECNLGASPHKGNDDMGGLARGLHWSRLDLEVSLETLQKYMSGHVVSFTCEF